MSEVDHQLTIHNEGRSVVTRDHRLAWETTQPGYEFPLDSLLLSGNIGSDAFTQVYLETTSGEMLRIDGEERSGLSGHLRVIDRDGSVAAGMLMTAMIPINEVGQLSLRIGLPFISSDIHTGPLMRIVLVSDLHLAVGKVNAPVGAVSPLFDKFKQGLSPIPDLRPNREGSFE